MEDLERDLLQAIAASPDDEPRLVYADWLCERGDPRGELITTLSALAAERSPPRRYALECRVDALVNRHGARWFAPLGLEPEEWKSYWFQQLVESMDRGFFTLPLYVTAGEHGGHRDQLLRLSPVLYVMDRTVARGHQNTVLRGRRVTPRSERAVCIKRPAHDTAPRVRADDVERGNAVVLHEARVLAFLGEHPNLPRLEGVGRRGDGHVVVTEWLEPQDLRARWGRDPPLPAVVELIAQLCSALQHMHARGAVHTALRPDNLVVTVEGHLKLIDFGRTKLGGEPAPEGYFLSGSDVLKGAFDFVSPEQVLGEPASPAADIFSAGALLYALACRRPPFAGHSGLAVLEAIQNVACPAPRSLRPELPAAIEAVIQRAMERDPAARFPTALAMHDALAQARQAQGWGAGTAQLAPTAAL